MKNLLKFFAVIAIITSFAGVSVAQTVVFDGAGNKATVEQDFSKSATLAAVTPDGCDTMPNAIIGYLPYMLGGGNTQYDANGVRVFNGYATRIAVKNQTNAGASANMLWYDASGQRFSINAQLFASSNSLDNWVGMGYSMTPYGAVSGTITIPGANVKTGYIKFCVTKDPYGNPAVGLSATFVHVTNGVIDGQATVLSVTPKTVWSLYVRRFITDPYNNQGETGISVANPNGQPATVTAQLKDSNGNPYSTGTFTVPAMGQMSAFLSQFLTTVWANGDGSLWLTSDVPIVVTGLENTGFNFSAIPAY